MTAHIETAWIKFRDIAGIGDAPALQQIEMRNAFYAGNASLYSTLMNLANNEKDDTVGQAYMGAVGAELLEFNEEIQRRARG